jgi:hypothetical protein
MSIKPLTLWGHWGAPNPFKVCIVLDALSLPYETRLLELSEVKQESYVRLNPNGRLPTLQDPNTGLDLSEVSCYLHFEITAWAVMLSNFTVWRDHSISRGSIRQRPRHLLRRCDPEISNPAMARFPDIR